MQLFAISFGDLRQSVCNQKALDLKHPVFFAPKVRIYFVFPSCDFDGFGWPQKSETHNFLNPLNGNNLLPPTSFGKTWGTLGTSPGEKSDLTRGKFQVLKFLKVYFGPFKKQGRMVEPRVSLTNEYRVDLVDPKRSSVTSRSLQGVSFE